MAHARRCDRRTDAFSSSERDLDRRHRRPRDLPSATSAKWKYLRGRSIISWEHPFVLPYSLLAHPAVAVVVATAAPRPVSATGSSQPASQLAPATHPASPWRQVVSHYIPPFRYIASVARKATYYARQRNVTR